MANEQLLQFIWNHKLAGKQFVTTNFVDVEVLHPGSLNIHAGPDFLEARIKIGDTVWAGNVEIHCKASDWLKHNHQKDTAYDNVILHVVAEFDKEIQRTNKEVIPTIVLPVGDKLNLAYTSLTTANKWIPCEDSVHQIDEFVFSSWKERLLIERIEAKVNSIDHILEITKNDWEQVLFISLCKSLSPNLNVENFERLAQKIPVNRLIKLKENVNQLEALLFGMAGLLPESSDNKYVSTLISEFNYVQHKYNLQPITGLNWKFLRTRPANFPTVRLAQLAQLIHYAYPMFSTLLAMDHAKKIKDFMSVQLSGYWETHYNFGKVSKASKKSLGQTTIHSFIINTMVPMLFTYGKRHQSTVYTDRAIELLHTIPSEQNTIIRGWKQLGVSSKHAADSQALIQLKKLYCDQKRCLECRVGANILSENIL